MNPSPNPHPLDYDWRYDGRTASMLVEMLSRYDRVLALGAPTVARLLENVDVNVTLVDRQPKQSARVHIVSSVEDFECEQVFHAAIVDPPWYPDHLERWARAAGRAVWPGGHIFLSVWPSNTRPSAVAELEVVLEKISSWASVERNVAELTYVEPLFEKIARNLAGDSPLSRSPLRGELIRLHVKSRPSGMGAVHGRPTWHRFMIDDYQLAVRAGPVIGGRGVRQVAGANGWRWPFVSARAAGMPNISIWSSDGEVGAVMDPEMAVAALRAAFMSNNTQAFKLSLEPVPELLNWRLPRPPYRRYIEWQHQQ